MKFSRAQYISFVTVTLLSSFGFGSPVVARTDEGNHLDCLPFKFSSLLTAKISIGKPLSPIPIPGGVLINEPITGGTVSGPAVNATIEGGFAHPSVYINGTLQVPTIDMYGTTTDGQSFYIHEVGIGASSAQVTRLEIFIGGAKYAPLANGYILASVNANANRTIVTVYAYLVENKPI